MTDRMQVGEAEACLEAMTFSNDQ